MNSATLAIKRRPSSADFLRAARVNRVLSDNVFIVKSGSGKMFALLNNNFDSTGGKKGQIKIRRDQNVNLGGEFRNVPTDEVAQETKGGGLDKSEYAQMKGQSGLSARNQRK